MDELVNSLCLEQDKESNDMGNFNMEKNGFSHEEEDGRKTERK